MSESPKPVRLEDLAQAAGVSKGTASNVFNRPGIVRDEVRNRVLKVAKTIGYHGPDPRGRALSAGKVNAIGVATNEVLSYFFEDPFARELMTAISDCCHQNGVGISLVSAANSEELVWNMRSAVVDGFILLCLEGSDRLIELSRERSLPFVALARGRNMDSEEFSIIEIDNFAAGVDAATYLAGLGHRRFGVLTIEFDDDDVSGLVTPQRVENAFHLTALDRLKGYWHGLAEFGINPNEVPVYETLSDSSTVSQALDAMYSGARTPTALLVQSDQVAFHALDWLASKGIRVPEQVSVIGIDGVPEAQKGQASLTTIVQPINEIGRKAVTAILNQGGAKIHEVLETHLVVRESTAPPPVNQ